jgi:UPF0755 protein
MRRTLAAIALALLVLAGGALFATWKVRELLSPRDPAGAVGFFVVPRGATLSRVARDLEAAGFVRSARATQLLGRWRALAAKLQPGEYELSPAMTPAAILQKIAAGEIFTIELAFPEGFSARQIAARVAASGLGDADQFLAVVYDPASPATFGVEGPTLEGYLFPATYRLPRHLEARELARVLVDRFLEAWAPLAEPARASGLSMRDVVTLASIVEKETGAAEERPLVASVYLNRLRIGMKLDSDPTVIYGIAGFDGNLRRAHLDDPTNVYNTYLRPGLPPGPIASPGEAALRAVVAPAETQYLYFVSRNDGTHVFTKSYAEHLREVDRWQRQRRQASP